MAFTITAVYIGGIAAFVLFVAGIITLLVTRNQPDKKKMGLGSVGTKRLRSGKYSR